MPSGVGIFSSKTGTERVDLLKIRLDKKKDLGLGLGLGLGLDMKRDLGLGLGLRSGIRD